MSSSPPPSSSSLLSPPLSSPNLDMSGQAILISGGTQGLGLACARLLKQNGAAGLVLVSRSQEKGEAACRELHSSDDGACQCRCVFVRCDVTDVSQVSSVVERGAELLGMPITGVVNAAATTARGNLFSTTPELFDEQMAVNCRAPFLMTQAAAKHMIQNNNVSSAGRRGGGGVVVGSIVNISSVAARGGAPFVMAYSASKAALSCMTKTHAAELASKGIRVNAIEMGWCLTDNEHKLQRQHSGDEWVKKADESVPLGRILRPEDVAATVCFLLSPASNMMTGSIVSLHPEFADGMLSLSDTDGPER